MDQEVLIAWYKRRLARNSERLMQSIRAGSRSEPDAEMQPFNTEAHIKAYAEKKSETDTSVRPHSKKAVASAVKPMQSRDRKSA